MNLTAGATLQNNKYVIRTLLSQSDWGMTYEAFHTYLECPVILQTLNPAMRQRSDFDELRQRFIAGVRQFTQLQRPNTPVRVLDCFHEEDWPFVVLERTGEQPLPDFLGLAPLTVSEAAAPRTDDAPRAAEDAAVPVADTITVPVADTAVDTATRSKTSSKANAMDIAAVVRAIAAKAAPAAERNRPQHQPENAIGNPDHNPDHLVVAATASPQLASSSDSLAAQAALPQVAEKADPLMPSSSASLPPHSSAQGLPRIIIPSGPRAKAWMPILLIASCIGGLLGIALGLSLRLSLVRQTAEQPRLAPALFSREQTFPGNGEWPVSEPPDYLAPQAVEQPVYRVSPPLESFGDPLPLPSPTTFAPPSPLPEEPPPLDPVEPIEPTADLNQPSPLPSAAPSAPPPAAVTLPPDPVPPPAAPVAPPPPLVSPPAVEPSPPEPAPRTAPPPMVIRQ
ncbi:MAG: hypothetical protein IGS38_06555 [Synechococcales cyanobacterium M58_A2018_015]|nr:hypothetical protein [Synechococcales cyanobacterium M58_A2018_015]